MSQNKSLNLRQSPDKWNGFVYLAWFMAIVTWLFSGYLLMEAGTVKLPYGDGSRLNVGVWAWVIGQSLGVLLLAGVFSMLNSIYKNSCHIPIGEASEDLEPAKNGVEILGVPPEYPLASKSDQGILVLQVNGQPVDSYSGIKSLAVPGENHLILKYPGGHTSRIKVDSENGSLVP